MKHAKTNKPKVVRQLDKRRTAYRLEQVQACQSKTHIEAFQSLVASQRTDLPA